MSERYTETWDEFLERYPDLVFVRTKKQVYTAAEIDENIVMEEDTLPLIRGKSIVIPIDESAFPKCLEYGSATEIGIYAVNICEQNDWDISPAMVREILLHVEENLNKSKNDEFSSI